MKVRASVKKISPDDILVRRKGRLRVINKQKHKILPCILGKTHKQTHSAQV